MSMKNFNAKQSGSEVILEEVNPFHKIAMNKSWKAFTPLTLTSIDPNIKVGQVIREDQLEPDLWQCYIGNGEYPNGAWINCLNENDAMGSKKLGATVRQVAKLKQPVHETPKSVHDLEMCIEKEGKVTGETPIQEEETDLTHLQLVKLWMDNSIEQANGLRDKGLESAALCSEAMAMAYKFCYSLMSENIPESVQEHKPESEENLNTLELGIEIVSAMKASLWDWDIESGRMDALSDTELDRIDLDGKTFDELSDESKGWVLATVRRERERLHKQAEFAAKCTLDWFKKQGFEITKKKDHAQH